MITEGQRGELKELILRYAEIREIEHGNDRRWLVDLHRGVLTAFIDSLTERADEEGIARRFHETYERLAPEFGYKTREASAVPWEAVPDANRRLMLATVREVLAPPERADTGEPEISDRAVTAIADLMLSDADLRGAAPAEDSLAESSAETLIDPQSTSSSERQDGGTQ